MSCAALEVCKRQRGPMHILALRRCTPAVVTIRWRGNVLRLGARSAVAQEPLGPWRGATPGAQVPRSGAGPCAFAHARPRPRLGSLPTSNPSREGEGGSPSYTPHNYQARASIACASRPIDTTCSYWKFVGLRGALRVRERSVEVLKHRGPVILASRIETVVICYPSQEP